MLSYKVSSSTAFLVQQRVLMAWLSAVGGSVAFAASNQERSFIMVRTGCGEHAVSG
jgi:hypothetical protein